VIEESGVVLAQVFYAEFLVFWAESELNRNYPALIPTVSCDETEAM